MTARLRRLFFLRDRAHSRGQLQRLEELRFQVKDQVKLAKSSWYNRCVGNLCNNSKGGWYREVAALTNRKPKPWKLALDYCPDDQTLTEQINNHFTEVCSRLPPLHTSSLPSYLPAEESIAQFQPWDVAKRLSQLRSNMATPPDDLPIRLIKEFAVELSIPLTDIYNRSLRMGLVPSLWRRSTIIPIPKKPKPTTLDELRPISLTPTFSKTLESLIAPLIMADIRPRIDPRQYGNMKKSSTTHYLVRLCLEMLTDLDKPGKLFSFVMYDFSKGFDLIDHSIVIERLYEMGLRPSLLHWFCGFLCDRLQRVRGPGGHLSEWAATSCGAPQGTLCGPIAFLAMINNGARDCEKRLKYVDDLTIYESCSLEQVDTHSSLQQSTQHLYNWASASNMVLNIQKCQVMHIFTSKKPLVYPDLTIGDNSIPVVNSCKLLGVTITNDLSWQVHVNNITSRAAKLLYILYTLKKFNAPVPQLIKAYITYIRPILEYCCPLFHAGLTILQAKQIEKIQRRVMKITLGWETSYQEALEMLGLKTLAERREELSLNFGRSLLKDERHRDLLPPRRREVSARTTRGSNLLQPFRCGSRLKKSCIPYITSQLNSLSL